jgi:Flp pilus assembly protein TadG
VTSLIGRLRARAAAEGERGSVTIWMIGVVVATFLMIGLLLDGGTMLRKRSDVFGIAAAAARVGAQQLDPTQAIEGHAVLDPIAAQHAVREYLAAHDLTGTVQVVGDTVTVDASATAELQMLKLVGGDSASFHATASARAVKVVNP